MDSIILKSFIPEIFLSFCILFQLILNAYLITNLKNNFPIIDKEILSQTCFILISLIFLLFNSKIEGTFSNFLFLNDYGSIQVKILFVISCLSILIILIKNFKLQKLNFYEYFTIFLLSILSLLLLISTSDMLSAYLVIEMQALSFYILASFRRNSAFSTEAGLKYFISGSFISVIFLFGCSIIYGILGTLNFNNLSLLFYIPFDLQTNNFINFFLLIGVLLIIITLAFKLSVVPFHFWSPDVYEGSPLSSTIIFSILPKLGLFHFFMKWLSITFFAFQDVLQFILLFLGILSVFVGTIFAIRQKRIKRFIIFSSIAQGGFLVTALSDHTLNNYISIYFFIFIYLITSILIWTNLSKFYSFKNKINMFNNTTISSLFLLNLTNFFKINTVWALSFLIIFFSIAGIPPLSGFFSKFLIIYGLINSGNLLVAFLITLISAISIFYYLRIIKIIFFETVNNDLKVEDSQIIFKDSFFNLECILISFFLFLLLFIFFYPTLLILFCNSIVLGSYYF